MKKNHDLIQIYLSIKSIYLWPLTCPYVKTLDYLKHSKNYKKR